MRLNIVRRSASIVIVIVAAAAIALWTKGTPPPVVSGEVVETYCWAKLRVGGPDHAACGIQCAKRGIPVAVVDAQSREVFILLPGKDKMALPPELIAAMGQNVNIRGEIVRRDGANFVAVQSWEPVR